MMMSNIPRGYKQTEMGVIPSDWEVKSLGELFQFQGGSQPSKDNFIFQEKEGYIRLLQIRDYKGDKYESYIPQKLAKRFCVKDDIMIGRYGPPIFQILNGLNGAYNVALIKAIPNEIISKKYGWFILKQEKLFQFVEKLSQRSSGQTGVDLIELKKYQIPLPPTKAEQTSIANALSDADALISRLEELIAKKRNIKQGAMQELLTGKKRLPGFSGEWELRKLGEIAEINMGQSHDSKNYNDKGIGIPLIQGNADIENRKSIKRIWTTQITKTCDKGDLIMTVRAPVGAIGIAFERSCIGRGVCSFMPKDVDRNFLYYLLIFHEDKWKIVEQGSTFTAANSSQIINFSLSIVNSKSEQIAIAQILSDMDAEIEQLGQKLDKYRLIKQGMMQELLTGKTRLI